MNQNFHGLNYLAAEGSLFKLLRELHSNFCRAGESRADSAHSVSLPDVLSKLKPPPSPPLLYLNVCSIIVAKY